MTTDSPVGAEHDSGRIAPRAGRSIHVQRALKLLAAGLVGGGLAAIGCLIVFAALHGSRGLLSAGLAALMVIFFYAVGQLVMAAFADAPARTLMVVSMVSYTGRMVLLGVLLAVVNLNRDNWTWLAAMDVFITAVAVVAGWLLVEVIVFNRLRISVYDQGYSTPEDAGAGPVPDGDQHRVRPRSNGADDAG